MRVQPASAAEIRSNCVVSSSILQFNSLPLTPQHVDEVAHLWCQVCFRVLEDVSHGSLELRWRLSKYHPSFEQECPQLVDDRRAPRDKPVAHSVNRLEVQLVIRLDRYKTHVLAFDRLRNRLRIHEIVLVRLHKGLHELGCDQPHIVALLPQCSSQKVRS